LKKDWASVGIPSFESSYQEQNLYHPLSGNVLSRKDGQETFLATKDEIKSSGCNFILVESPMSLN